MKIFRLYKRIRASLSVLKANPELLLRLPGFISRSLAEGPRATLFRLRDISNPLNQRFAYKKWFSIYSPTNDEKLSMAAWVDITPNLPQISVLMPVYNPNPDWLQEAIDSVRTQIYPNWQLCIADDCSTDPKVKHLLVEANASDPRISVVFRENNGHICLCSNSALELVSSPWLALLDHDDLLTNDALIWVAKAIMDNPDALLFYSDEDKINANGDLCDPHFKGDWNPLLMEGQNTFCHLGVYSTDLVRSLGGFRKGFEGSQDHDLVLRCSESLGRDQIVHIPRVLYHWRIHPGSTAFSSEAKPYHLEATKKVIKEHLLRQGLPVSCVSWTNYGSKAELQLPVPSPKISVIIPTRNSLAVLQPCIESLICVTNYQNFEVIVVDNGSDDPDTIDYITEQENRGCIRIISDPSPFNYSALNNYGVEQAQGEFVCLMNNDIEVIHPEWLNLLLAQCMRPNIGAVGARLLYPDRTIQHGGVVLGVGGVAIHAHHGLPADHPGHFCRAQLLQEVSAVTGACLLVRKSYYQDVGGLDSECLPIAFNDIDFCLKLSKIGLKNVYEPSSVLIHHESISRGYEDTPEKKLRFESDSNIMKARWGLELLQDPFYNPNMSLEHLYGLSSPPRIERWNS